MLQLKQSNKGKEDVKGEDGCLAAGRHDMMEVDGLTHLYHINPYFCIATFSSFTDKQ